MNRKTLVFKWTVSRGRDTYGYNICSLWVNNRKVASCNGGGYDMKGTCLGQYIEGNFQDRLTALEIPMTTRNGKPIQEYYGLTFHDPNYDPAKAVIGEDCDDRTIGQKSEGKTVEEAEAEGVSAGLERYQAFYKASSRIPTERHTVAILDGGCGWSSMVDIARAIGLKLNFVHESRNETIYALIDERTE